MGTFYLNVQHVERASLAYPDAMAMARTDFSHWRIGAHDWSRPLESKLREMSRLRMRTTTDSIKRDDGTYSESGFAFTSGWTIANEHKDGMPHEQVVRLIHSTHAYVTYLGGLEKGFVNIQHPDAPAWFLEAVKASKKYRLRLGLQLTRESEQWSMNEPRQDRAKAFTWRHPLFFNIPYAEFVRA